MKHSYYKYPLFALLMLFSITSYARQTDGLIRLQIDANGKNDEVVSYFVAGATEGFDQNLEAVKIQSSPAGWPTVWVPVADKLLQIAAYPTSNLAYQEIPVQLLSGVSGVHTFRATEISSFPESTAILLEDRDKGITVTLTKNAVYQVDLAAGGNYNRFFLIVQPKPEPVYTVTWDGSSWSNGTGPTDQDNVLIESNYTGTSNLSFNTLKLASGVTFESSGNLTVKGDLLVENGVFTATGSININGSETQLIGGNLHEVTINNSSGVGVGSATAITGKLNLSVGILETNARFTLKASQENTAYIVYGDGSILGDVTVERIARDNSGDLSIYSGAGRRFMSSPTSNATVGGVAGFSPNLSGAATYNTTGPSVLSPSNFPNIFLYDEGRVGSGDAFSKGWVAPTASSDALAAGLGFALEVEQDAVVSLTGPLNTGRIDVATNSGGHANSGWHLLGNPYASPIDLGAFLEDVDNGHLYGTAFLRHPTSRYQGEWVSYVGATGVSTPANLVEGNALAPMQSFMVYASTAGTASFKEGYRIDPAGFNVLRTKSGHEGLLRLQLTKGEQFDEVVVYLHDAASSGFDSNYDAVALEYGNGNNLLLKSNEDALKINAVSSSEEFSQPLGVWIAEAGEQTFELNELSGWNSGLTAYLEDRLTGKLIKLREGTSYGFKAMKGWQEDRFFLHLRTASAAAVEAAGEELSRAGLELFTYGQTIAVNAQASESMSLTVYSLSGAVVQQASFKGSQRIETSLTSGIYLLKLETAEGVVVKRVKL